MAVRVVRVGPDDWRVWRAIRLRALATDPHAFAASREHEESVDEAQWRAWLEGPSVLAYVDDQPVAMGGGFPDRPGLLMVVAMWTDPGHRDRGLGGRILEEVVAAASDAGLRNHLFVARGNDDAARLYERHGFVRSGLVESHGGLVCDQLLGPEWR